MIRGVIVLLCLLATGPAVAQQQTSALASIETVFAEARIARIEGPVDNTQRAVLIWRPSNAPPGPLPVLYMGDGGYGLYVAVAGLRQPILDGRIPPIVVVATEASPTRRTQEYVPSRTAMNDFERHERWFIETVIPFAERIARASSDPAQRAIGGYSNSADFALSIAERHPDMFGMVLAHSPVNWKDFSLDARAAHIRWVLTAGRHEFENGEIVDMIDRYANEIQRNPSPIRRCVGYWDHVGEAWRDVSPGSVAWLFQFPAAPDVETVTERETCRIMARR